jgi:hypothetical protein
MAAASFNHQLRLYEQAIAMADAGTPRGAIVVLERLLPGVQDPDLARSVRELLLRLKAPLGAP